MNGLLIYTSKLTYRDKCKHLLTKTNLKKRNFFYHILFKIFISIVQKMNIK